MATQVEVNMSRTPLTDNPVTGSLSRQGSVLVEAVVKNPSTFAEVFLEMLESLPVNSPAKKKAESLLARTRDSS